MLVCLPAGNARWTRVSSLLTRVRGGMNGMRSRLRSRGATPTPHLHAESNLPSPNTIPLAFRATLNGWAVGRDRRCPATLVDARGSGATPPTWLVMLGHDTRLAAANATRHPLTAGPARAGACAVLVPTVVTAATYLPASARNYGLLSPQYVNYERLHRVPLGEALFGSVRSCRC